MVSDSANWRNRTKIAETSETRAGESRMSEEVASPSLKQNTPFIGVFCANIVKAFGVSANLA